MVAMAVNIARKAPVRSAADGKRPFSQLSPIWPGLLGDASADRHTDA